SVHPKSRGINARTMEIFHQCGVEDAVRAAGLPHHHTGLIVWSKSLAGEEIERRVPWRARGQSGQVSPIRNCLCAQDDLEPVLRALAEKQDGAKLLSSTEARGFEQGRDGVVVTLLDLASRERRDIRARYVIAADGAQSRIRRELGVRML